MTSGQLDRFVIKIQPLPSGCWKWSAALFKNGYGQFYLPTARASYAHRVSYEYFIGPIADRLEIDHLCRNRACVNPTHLEAVQHVVNVRRGNAMLPTPSVVREKISQAKRGGKNPQTPEWTAKIAEANRGKRRTAEQREKLSQSLRGKPKSLEARARMSVAAKKRCERQRQENAA